jgi:S1-C subfamily serine protease
MKWQMVLTVLVAAVVGALAGNLASRGSAVDSPAQGSSSGFAGNADDQTRIVQAVRRDSPSVVALDVSADALKAGSGFVYNRNGLILTTDHVIHGASLINAVFANGTKVAARVFGEDPADDIALLKVNYGHLPPPLALGNSDTIEQGDWVIAIGEPLTLQQTVTVGVASALGREEHIMDADGVLHRFKNLLQTSAPMNEGNSGGPLLNLSGDVIAINQSIAEPAQGIGFAVPSNTIKSGIAYIQQHTRVARAHVGFVTAFRKLRVRIKL